MLQAKHSRLLAGAVILGLGVGSACLADALFTSDFSKGDFATLGWKADGAWDAYYYKDAKDANPGFVARFGANKPEGTLTKTFAEVANPKQLKVDLDAGWGWGAAGQGSDSLGFMLLDSKGNGYTFEVHRVKANWAIQWAHVAGNSAPKDKTWAPDVIDCTHKSVLDGGGLMHLTLTRDADGTFTFSSKDWNAGAGGQITFKDGTTTSFSQIVLLGTTNSDEDDYDNVSLDVTK